MNPETKTHKLVVRGVKVRTRTPRRYATVAVRPNPVTDDDGRVLVAYAQVLKRTDNLQTAHAERRKFGIGRGTFAVVIDLNTGEEVPSGY